MFEPEPLPGTHLARVDCIVCGAPVLAVPHMADRARCSGCWRDTLGLSDSDAPPTTTPGPGPRT